MRGCFSEEIVGPTPAMDHRGLIVSPHALITVGGMEARQRVSAQISNVAIP